MSPPAPADISSGNVTGIVLAGGQGRRMGNRDKGWVAFRGKPMIEHVVERLRPQVSHLMISANRNLSDYQKLGHTVVTDSGNGLHNDEGYQGPIAGIISCLNKITTDYAVIVPCDAPLVPTELVTTLLHATEPSTRLVLLNLNGRLQPLFGLYHRSLVYDLRAYFESGNRKLVAWCEAQNPRIVTLTTASTGFANINSPDELSKMESGD